MYVKLLIMSAKFIEPNPSQEKKIKHIDNEINWS